MSTATGKFIWHELVTSEPAAAARFYGAVLGWDRVPNGRNELPYDLFMQGEVPAAGLMALPADAAAQGARPCWMGYVGVTDVDATVAAARQHGGRLHHGPDDIPGVGRFAVIADPHGAALVVMASTMPTPSVAPREAPAGRLAWNELMAGDLATDFAFYEALFGWQRAAAHDMGPMGVYQLFAHEGVELGGMMTKPAILPMAFWQFYIRVDAIEAAKARVIAGGGQVLNGPMPVPGGDWVLQALDPQGVLFGLVGKAG
jgi:predicted enzyme related to lactoylglutathione lyase